jgi:hypothetical protein
VKWGHGDAVALFAKRRRLAKYQPENKTVCDLLELQAADMLYANRE